MNRYLCVHGHFYQPPRQNPFVGQIPQEPGAEPFANFNERITAECYRPNADLANFDRLSFNIGPTLAEWLERHAPEVYERILKADYHYRRQYGCGNAIAQVYNHVILPLAPARDKHIQIAWGIADFRHRFGREPEGMWLAETAVDYDTLEVLVDNNIVFTVLAPWQAEASTLDVTEPYKVPLPSGRSIVVFFYDAHLSGKVRPDPRVAYAARGFARFSLPMRLNLRKYRDGEAQLLLMASDGENYGHSGHGREVFLHNLLYREAPEQGYQITSLPLYVLQNPPIREMQILENTAWSCVHGLTRWQNHCSCIGIGDGTWKNDLRTALDRLRDQLDTAYVDAIEGLVKDPDRLLREYIGVKSCEVSLQSLLENHVIRPLTADEQERVGLVLESQYYRQLMYTSCGFFFEDVDRIEPKNNLAFAGMAISLAERATGLSLENTLVKELQSITSWRSQKSGPELYQQAKEGL